MHPGSLRLAILPAIALALLYSIGATSVRAEDAPAEPAKGPPIVSFKSLLAFLPAAPEGWTAEKPEGNTVRMGAVEMTVVTAKYAKGESTASIEIIDYAWQRDTMKGLTMGWQLSNESTDGYQRGFSVDGSPGYETFSQADKIGNVFLIAGDRFFVHIEIQGEKAGTAREWLQKIDLKALATTK